MDIVALDKLKEIENSKTLIVDNANCLQSNQETYLMTSTYYLNINDNQPAYRVEKHVRNSDNVLIWLDIEDLQTRIHLTTSI